MIDRILYIFLMGVIIKCISTVKSIVRIGGHKFMTMFLIAVDTILFVFIFSDVLSNDLDIPVLVALICGYLIGYYIGTLIEEKMALGKAFVTIKIAKKDSKELAQTLKKKGFIFVQSKRFYSHKGKLRKIHQGIVYRKELPKLEKLLDDFKVIATVQNVKKVFGKDVISSEDYLRFQREDGII
ncbi:MAG: hypothetical protein ACOCRX_01210 [Candidatus Woesearchaeota archaeon]